MQGQKEIKNHIALLMIGTAVLFDAVQWLLAFVFMDWLVGIFALLTFFVWFKLYGISFMNAKRGGTMLVSFVIESIPWLASLPAWTLAVAVIIADTRVKKAVSTATGSIGPKPADNQGQQDKAA